MGQITPPSSLSRLSSWGYECLNSQITQLKAPLRSSFPSWNVLLDLANRVKYIALVFIVGFAIFRTVTANSLEPTRTTHATEKTSVTFTQSRQGNTISFSCYQDVVSFSTSFSNDYIVQLKEQGYKGLQLLTEVDREKLIQEQNYVEILKLIWTEDNLDFALKCLEPYANQGHAILMMEMSRTLCRKMQATHHFPPETIIKALQWQWQGLLTTQLDVACNKDKSSGAAIGMLQDSYTLGRLIPKNELEKIDLQKVVDSFCQQCQLLDSYPSPKWVTYHGMKAFLNKNSLLPESEWNAKRAAEFQKFKSQVKPSS